MMTVINYILSLTWLGDVAKKVNGNKTYIGLIALVVYNLGILPKVFPEWGLPEDMGVKAQEVLAYLGILFPWGALHKVTKNLEK